MRMEVKLMNTNLRIITKAVYYSLFYVSLYLDHSAFCSSRVVPKTRSQNLEETP